MLRAAVARDHRLDRLQPDHLVQASGGLVQSGGRRGRPLSATTVRTVHRVLSKSLNDVVRDGAQTRNPAAYVPLRRVMKPELQGLQPRQLVAFLVRRRNRLYAAWLLALLCGLRRGELAGLR